jgi:hypothetical protein
MVGVGKGIILTMLADPKATFDYAPVDIYIDFIFLDAWFLFCRFPAGVVLLVATWVLNVVPSEMPHSGP